MRRRSFLKWQMQGALLAAGGRMAAQGLFSTAHAATPPHVVICRGLPAEATRAAVETLGGMSHFVQPGQTVLIKPNMSFAYGPNSAATTSPEVVLELIRLCREAKAGRIRVVDHPLQNPQRCLIQSGIQAVCERMGPDICHMRTDPRDYRNTWLPKALVMTYSEILREALDSRVIIAVPVAKSHSGTKVSLSLKGQMGLVLYRQDMHARYPLEQAIVDLNTLIAPHLTVIDATRVLSTNGPAGPGQILRPREVIASADPVAADAVTTARYPWDYRTVRPAEVEHIRLAHEQGLGCMDSEKFTTGYISL